MRNRHCFQFFGFLKRTNLGKPARD